VTDPIWIEEPEVVILQSRLLALDGGQSGVRDIGLLRSALARLRNLQAYGRSPNIVAMAAAYTFGIVRNHPFLDGNKRAGFVVGVWFLELNGFQFSASEESAAQAIFALASGEIDEVDLASWMRANTRPADA
jgi:death on curing protein